MTPRHLIHSRYRFGFTLIELLVVIAIVALLRPG
jgi:prepilin-type N-terminal cleavage/methylation domain-containing protein